MRLQGCCREQFLVFELGVSGWSVVNIAFFGFVELLFGNMFEGGVSKLSFWEERISTFSLVITMMISSIRYSLSSILRFKFKFLEGG